MVITIKGEKYLSLEECIEKLSNFTKGKIKLDKQHFVALIKTYKNQGIDFKTLKHKMHLRLDVFESLMMGNNRYDFINRAMNLYDKQIGYKEQVVTEPSYNNDENDMEKFSKELEKKYQFENRKIVRINESQLKKLVESFTDEGFQYDKNLAKDKDFMKNPNNKIDMNWVQGKENIGKRRDADDTTKYNNVDDVDDEKDLTMHPTVVKLPRSKIDCYNLYKMSTTELQQAIKHKTWGVGGAKVKWNRDNFFNQSAEYAQDLINNVVGRLKYNAMRYGEEENIDVGYISFPSSSSHFNDFFVKKIQKYFPNAKIVKDFFLKRKSGLGIDYDMAELLKCDALDVAKLEKFIVDADAKEKTINLREKVEKIIDTTSADFFSNIYNFNSKDDKYGKKEIVKDLNKTTVGYDKNMKRIKSFDEMSEDDYKLITQLTDLMLKIYKEYGDLSNAYIEIEKRRAQNVSNKKYTNLNHDNEKLMSNFSSNAEKTLNNTLTDRKTWQIKKQGEYARKILRNLFMLDDNQWVEMEKDKEDKVVVIFDDKMAGGATMDNVCYTLIERNWKYIIPLTLAVMPITTGVNVKDASKQRDRDKAAGFGLANSIKDNRVEKLLSYDFNDGETIHNINKVYGDSEYDYDNVSTYNKRIITKQTIITKNTKPITPKYRGRIPNGNFQFGGSTFSSNGIVDLSSAKNFLRRTFPNRSFRNIDKLANDVLFKATEAREKLNRYNKMFK